VAAPRAAVLRWLLLVLLSSGALASASAMSAADMRGYLSGGFSEFYKTSRDVDQGAPHLRTYEGRQAEKFFETFALPTAAPRPGKAAAPPLPESLTWGMGGTAPCGRKLLKPQPAEDFRFSQKRFLIPDVSGELAHGEDMGRKRHVFDAAGMDLKQRMSNGYLVEDMMSRKTRVPEEMRTEARTIHRWAPPGLKGYMGAEYSNDFFTTAYMPNGFGRHKEGVAAKPSSGLGSTRKSFAQKRLEEEVAEQVALVARLQQPLDEDEEAEGEREQIPVEQ